MTFGRLAFALSLAQLGSPAWNSEPAEKRGTLTASRTALCSIMPGNAVALIQVERDTLLPAAGTIIEPMTSSSVASGPADSLLATGTTLMPAARVRLLNADSATRALLASHDVSENEPLAYLIAAPYRADCRIIRWTRAIPFTVEGETGFIRGVLAPRDKWVNGMPLIVIANAGEYPYPRQRGLAFPTPPDSPLAPAEAMFAINAILEMPRPESLEMRLSQDNIKRERAIDWARANRPAADIEPVRTVIRRAVLGPDWGSVSRTPSRLRGSYRVRVEADSGDGTFFFRTHERPGYEWRGAEADQSTAALLNSPHVFGYSLVGLATTSRDSLPMLDPNQPQRVPLVWLVTDDRPTAAGNDSRNELRGYLEFQQAVLPERLWNDLETFARPMSATDSALMARLNRQIPRSRNQVRLPLTLSLNSRGDIRADTVITAGGHRVRISLERTDTLSVKRPF